MATKRSKKKLGISIVIPCYNESKKVLKNTLDSIEASLKKIGSLNYEIIIVNDGSNLSYNEFNAKKIRVINHEMNKGYGVALKTGIKNSKYEYIGITDADSTYPVDKFHLLIKYMSDYDMVVGARPWNKISFIRRVPKYILTSLASFLANYKIPDLNSGFRVFRKDVAEKFWNLYPNGFSFTSTITMGCLTNGYSVKYVTIDYFKRDGKSHIHPIKDTIRFFSLILRLTLYFNPLRFFIPVSLFIFLLAILRGLRDFYKEGFLGGLTLLLFFMAFQVFFFGLLAEIISKTRR